ncbi:MAG TPA: porin PorA family protein [Acidimicrobiales bacterium]|nr:porin PorA family protein [Acidimicrobiales bacterium]
MEDRGGRRRGPWIIGGIGALFVIAALIWTAVAAPALLKYPTDLNVNPKYEGTFRLYLNPTNATPLDQPVTAPLTVDRVVKASPGSSSSKLAVVDETLTLKAGSLVDTTQQNEYVMDRRTMKNVSDPRAYAFNPENPVDRAGAYRLQLPFGVALDQQYKVYKNEIGGTYSMKTQDAVAGTYEKDGLTLTRFAGTAKNLPLSPAYLTELKKTAPLPESMTIDQMKPLLKSKGVDVDALLAALLPSLSPDDTQALVKLAGTPIPLQYVLSFEGKMGIERTTGSEVDLTSDIETVGVMPAPASVDALTAILGKYPQVPAAASASTALKAISNEPIPVFQYDFSQTPASVKAIAKEVKSQRTLVIAAQRWIPWSLAALGIVLLLVGAFLGLRHRRDVVAAAAPRPRPAHA